MHIDINNTREYIIEYLASVHITRTFKRKCLKKEKLLLHFRIIKY